MKVSFNERASVPGHVLVRFLDKECVLLNLKTERYFGLDETGARMWQLVTTRATIESAYRQLQEEFEVDRGLLRANLTDLVASLSENGLLVLSPADRGTAPEI